MPDPRKPATLRARWRGHDPEPGHYLKSEGQRARTAYLIADVARAKGLAMLDGLHHLRLKVWRVAPSEVPAGAVVHPWKWDSRAPRRSSLANAPTARRESENA